MPTGAAHFWPVIDGHADTLVQSAIENRSFFQRNSIGHLDLFRLWEAGIDLQILAICAEKRPHPYQFALDLLKDWERAYTTFQINSGSAPALIWIRTKEDFAEWEAERKLGVILALEGLEPLEGKVQRLVEFYQLGVRIASLTWNWDNPFASGVNCEQDSGLTALGKAAVRLAEQLGYVVDLAHLGYNSFFDVLEVAEQPVLVSHANVFNICPHRRNLKDEQIKAIAEKGGTVGLTFYPPFIGKGRVGIGELLKHLDYLLHKWGEELPAMGGDFDGIDVTPSNLRSVLDLDKLIRYLEAQGLSLHTTGLFLGGNLYRVLKQNFSVPDQSLSHSDR
ncbi:MAG TPA: membrane dipeptidase [Bacillota bacterium]